MEKGPLLLSLFLFLSISSCRAEIKDLRIESDSRPIIHFEQFGFTRQGAVSVSIHNVTVTPPPSAPSDLGFFLLSDKEILQAVYDSEHRQDPSSESVNPNPTSNEHCVLSSDYMKTLFNFGNLSPPPASSYSNSFSVLRPDEYGLFFANCAPGTLVSMTVRTVMYNARPDGSRDYLSVGRSPLPSLYSIFAIVYMLFLAAWTYLCLFKNRLSTHRIHYLMAALLLVKALNLVFAAEDLHYIRTTGTPHGWDLLFYLFQFLKGVLLFTVIVLIGTGWSFLKPFLQEREKKVLMIVIPLQVIANVATMVIGETGPFIKGWFAWHQVFLFIDIACCCAILFPIVWSIRTLRETSKTDGKAARNLAKLTLFRKFYVSVVGYLYFTRIVVFALKTISTYKYQWVSDAANEAASLAFYVFMFYMFRPMERNQYFVLDDEEEEAAQVALREVEFEL